MLPKDDALSRKLQDELVKHASRAHCIMLCQQNHLIAVSRAFEIG